MPPILQLQHTIGNQAVQSLLLQRRLTNQAAESDGVSPVIREVLHSPGQPLDPSTRAFVEQRFGHNFAEVRVHTDSRAAASAAAVNARAYTVGRNLVFGKGQYAPTSSEGRKLLAHELAHVVQQSDFANSVSALSADSLISHPEDDSEQEAERVSNEIIGGAKSLIRTDSVRHSVPSAVRIHRAILPTPVPDDEKARRAQAVLDQARQAPSDPNFTARLQGNERTQFEARLQAAEAALRSYRAARGSRGSSAAFGTTTTNPLGALLALGALVIGAAALTQTAVQRDAARALDNSMEGLRDLAGRIMSRPAPQTTPTGPITSDIIQAINAFSQAIEEGISNNPGPSSRCDEEIKRFRDARQEALDALANPRRFGDLGVTRRFGIWKRAANVVIACLGLPLPPLPLP